MKLNELLQSDHFEEKEEICPGCQNHCQVRVYSFANGRQYVSGNNCERVYSNEGDGAHKGINMFEEKYKLLFEQRPPSAERPLHYKTANAERWSNHRSSPRPRHLRKLPVLADTFRVLRDACTVERHEYEQAF